MKQNKRISKASNQFHYFSDRECTAVTNRTHRKMVFERIAETKREKHGIISTSDQIRTN